MIRFMPRVSEHILKLLTTTASFVLALSFAVNATTDEPLSQRSETTDRSVTLEIEPDELAEVMENLELLQNYRLLKDMDFLMAMRPEPPALPPDDLTEVIENLEVLQNYRLLRDMDLLLVMDELENRIAPEAAPLQPPKRHSPTTKDNKP